MNIQFIISELRAEGLPINKANIKNKVLDLRNMQSQLDAALDEIDGVPGENDTAQHDVVEAYLKNLKEADRDQFEQVRRKPFAELVVLAGA